MLARSARKYAWSCEGSWDSFLSRWAGFADDGLVSYGEICLVLVSLEECGGGLGLSLSASVVRPGGWLC